MAAPNRFLHFPCADSCPRREKEADYSMSLRIVLVPKRTSHQLISQLDLNEARAGTRAIAPRATQQIFEDPQATSMLCAQL